MIEVCPVCYKFLQTIYDKKKMKEIKLTRNWSTRSVLLLQQQEMMKKDKGEKV